jgi:hypothetical protein
MEASQGDRAENSRIEDAPSLEIAGECASMKAIWNGTGVARTAVTSARISLWLRAPGFSSSTAWPRLSASRT